jgi:hypothetical protein
LPVGLIRLGLVHGVHGCGRGFARFMCGSHSRRVLMLVDLSWKGRELVLWLLA